MNQRLIPVLIDASGLLEGAIVRTTSRVRRGPIASILLLPGLGGSGGVLAIKRLRAVH